jgi:hypothetical protein
MYILNQNSLSLLMYFLSYFDFDENMFFFYIKTIVLNKSL